MGHHADHRRCARLKQDRLARVSASFQIEHGTHSVDERRRQDRPGAGRSPSLAVCSGRPAPARPPATDGRPQAKGTYVLRHRCCVMKPCEASCRLSSAPLKTTPRAMRDRHGGDCGMTDGQTRGGGATADRARPCSLAVCSLRKMMARLAGTVVCASARTISSITATEAPSSMAPGQGEPSTPPSESKRIQSAQGGVASPLRTHRPPAPAVPGLPSGVS